MTWHRILRTAQVTLTQTVTVDEALTDAVAPLTTSLKRLDGTEVAAGTSTRTSVGTYTYTPPAQANLDLLTLSWTGVVAGASTTFEDVVEIVGGYLFDLGRARARYPELKDPAKVSPARLAEVRTEIEVEFEAITGAAGGATSQAFVPRFGRHRTIGRGTPYLWLPEARIRRARSVTIDGVALDPAVVAALRCTETGRLIRPFGALWPNGSDVVVEYEHGMTTAPPPVSTAGILRVRSLVFPGASGVPDRAQTVVTPEGASYQLSMPSALATGIPDVDGTLAKFPAPRRVVTA
jgi:hypothetical protein